MMAGLCYYSSFFCTSKIWHWSWWDLGAMRRCQSDGNLSWSEPRCSRTAEQTHCSTLRCVVSTKRRGRILSRWLPCVHESAFIEACVNLFVHVCGQESGGHSQSHFRAKWNQKWKAKKQFVDLCQVCKTAFCFTNLTRVRPTWFPPRFLVQWLAVFAYQFVLNLFGCSL